ncbi:DegQ family serine endoprotease [Marinobacteraceae bacterium S3BR75-40.1]
MQRRVVSFHALFLGLALLLAGTVYAALPSTLADGEPMPSLAPMVEKVAPAVVNIATFTTVKQVSNPLLSDPFFKRFFNVPDQPQKRTSSAGSGVIVDAEKGYVMTNHHVVGNADEITVTLRDGREYNAEVVGSDEQTDIALLQIPAENLTDVPLAKAGNLRVGDFVVALGNPFALGQTVTSGIVSALGRHGLGIENYEDFIQTDASINPGNSGGALVNLRGELVGINSAILSPGGGNVGIGFAIPTAIAMAVKDQLIEFGEVRRGQLGILFQDLTPKLAEAFELDQRKGALIARVRNGSPAQKAGLKSGDVVIEIDGHAVKNASDLQNRLGLSRVGKPLSLTVVRDGEPLTVEAALEAPKAHQLSGKQVHPDLSGVLFEDKVDNSAGAVVGVIAKEVAASSNAYRAGLRPGDLLVAVNRRRLKSVADLAQLSGQASELLLQLQRGDRQFYLVAR